MSDDELEKERKAYNMIRDDLARMLKKDPLINKVYDDLNFRGYINKDMLEFLSHYLKIKNTEML